MVGNSLLMHPNPYHPLYAVLPRGEELILPGQEAGNDPSLPPLLSDSLLIRPHFLSKFWVKQLWIQSQVELGLERMMWNLMSLIMFYFNNGCDADAMIPRTSCVLKIFKGACSCCCQTDPGPPSCHTVHLTHHFVVPVKSCARAASSSQFPGRVQSAKMLPIVTVFPRQLCHRNLLKKKKKSL